MTEAESTADGFYDEVEAIFAGELNRRGFSFQYAVLAEIGRLYSTESHGWMFIASEIPVQHRDKDTHVDFALRFVKSNHFIVGECKRVNPAFGAWCFVRSPMIERNDGGRHWLLEDEVSMVKGLPPKTERRIELRTLLDDSYHIGFEMKLPNSKGDPCGHKGGLDESVGQLMRCLGGFHKSLLSSNHGSQVYTARILPVLFTTARLFTSNVDLRSAELKSGEIPRHEIGLQEVDWLFWQYNPSVGLRPEFPHANAREFTKNRFMVENYRTVPVVSSVGLRSFFAWAKQHAIDLIESTEEAADQ